MVDDPCRGYMVDDARCGYMVDHPRRGYVVNASIRVKLSTYSKLFCHYYVVEGCGCEVRVELFKIPVSLFSATDDSSKNLLLCLSHHSRLHKYI